MATSSTWVRCSLLLAAFRRWLDIVTSLRDSGSPANCTTLSKVAYVLRSFFQSLCLIKLDAAGARRRAFGLRASSLARRRRSPGRSTSGHASRIEQERPRATRFRSVSWKAEALPQRTRRKIPALAVNRRRGLRCGSDREGAAAFRGKRPESALKAVSRKPTR